MARPTQTRINAGPGYAPDVGRAPALQVVAPLNVQAAPSGAELLANSLGVALDVAAPVMLDRMQKKAADSTALGRADATMNKADAKRQAEDASYAVGVKRGMVDRAIVDFKSRAKEFYNTEFDKSKGTELLAQELDGIAKGMLQNYSGDADAARWMTPEVMNTVNQITGAHDAELAAQFKEDRVASAGALVRDAVVNEQPVDAEEIMSRLRPILGNSEAQKAYVGIVGSLAVELRSPGLIDVLIPDKWADGTPGPRSVPDLNRELNQSRYYAEAGERDAKQEVNAASKAQADSLMMKLSLDALRGIDPLPALELSKELGIPITDADARAVHGSYLTNRDDIREQAVDTVGVAQFRAQMLTDVKAITPGDMVAFVANNFPPGKDGYTQANILFDDYVSAVKANEATKANPLAKAYRESLTSQFKPDTGASTKKKERYAAGMLAFDLEMVNSGDADKARKASLDVFEKTGPIAGQSVAPSTDLVNDVTSFASGEMSAADFTKAYGADADVDRIMNAVGKGITVDQARKALTELNK